jgi:hypothetical protein
LDYFEQSTNSAIGIDKFLVACAPDSYWNCKIIQDLSVR